MEHEAEKGPKMYGKKSRYQALMRTIARGFHSNDETVIEASGTIRQVLNEIKAYTLHYTDTFPSEFKITQIPLLRIDGNGELMTESPLIISNITTVQDLYSALEDSLGIEVEHDYKSQIIKNLLAARMAENTRASDNLSRPIDSYSYREIEYLLQRYRDLKTDITNSELPNHIKVEQKRNLNIILSSHLKKLYLEEIVLLDPEYLLEDEGIDWFHFIFFHEKEGSLNASDANDLKRVFQRLIFEQLKMQIQSKSNLNTIQDFIGQIKDCRENGYLEERQASELFKNLDT